MRNKSLDILKFLSSIFVVFIHITFAGPLGITIKAIASFAVPIFFLSSGYFSLSAINNFNYKKLLKRCIPLAKILVASLAIFALCEIIFNGEANFITDLKSIKTYIMLFVFNNFSDGFFIPLWFLPALIYTYVTIALVVILKWNRLIYYFPILLLVSMAFYDVVLGYMDKTISHIIVRNFLFIGLPYFSIGYLLNQYKESLKKISNIWLIVFALVGILMILLENKLLNSDAGTYIGSLLLSVSLFERFNRFSISIKNKRLSYCISKVPLYIYIFHIPVNSVLCRFKINERFNEYIYPFMVLCITVTIAVIISHVGYILFVNGRKHKDNYCS